jgi:hypothetical protein
VIKRKCVSYSYIKSKEKLIIVLKKYCIKVNRLFVFQCFSNVFKRGFCEIEKGSLGLAERSRVGEKGGVVSKDISKKVCKL